MPKRKTTGRETSLKGCKRGCRVHDQEGIFNYKLFFSILLAKLNLDTWS